MPVSSDEETLEKVNTVTKNGPRTNQLITNESNPEDFILSQPRELYASHKRPGPEQLPRWPAECEVACPANKHLMKTPKREPYYFINGHEPQPEPWGERYPLVGGCLVFNYEINSPVPYFTRSCIEGAYLPVRLESFEQPSWVSKEPKKDDPSLDRISQSGVSYSLESEKNKPGSILNNLYDHVGPMIPPDDWYGSTVPPLKFESRFESGNLAKAVQLTASLYELYLRSDLFCNRHASWFYFRVENMKSGFVYRFSIVNMLKSDSLYRDGLKPLMYSEKNASVSNIGWQRCGDNITYFKNESLVDGVQTYTLTFAINFPYTDDVVYLASCYPYTYTDLQSYLSNIQADPVKSKICKVRLLCRSLAGNCVHVLTITQPQSSVETTNLEPVLRPAVVLTARVHPCETPSSWAIKGIIDFLTSRSAAAKALREKFIFKIIPMLNPDGVIVGNSRCSLAGRDLNRQYRAASREATPSIWHTKLLIKKLQEEREVLMYCDIHSHGRSHNSFMYGCEARDENGTPTMLEQIFPLMFHKNTVAKFSFKQSKFVIQKNKEGTGRVVSWTMGIPLSYTLEISIAGSTLGNRRRTHFTITDLEAIGRIFCRTLMDYFTPGSRQVSAHISYVTQTFDEGANSWHSEDEYPWKIRQRKSRRKHERKVDYLNVARSISKQQVNLLRDSSTSSRSPSLSPTPTPNVSRYSSPVSSRRHSMCHTDPKDLLLRLVERKPPLKTKKWAGKKSNSLPHRKRQEKGVATTSGGSSPDKNQTWTERKYVSNVDLDSSGDSLSVAGLKIISADKNDDLITMITEKDDKNPHKAARNLTEFRKSKKKVQPFRPDASIFCPIFGSHAPRSLRPSRAASVERRPQRKTKDTKPKTRTGRGISLLSTKNRSSKSQMVCSEVQQSSSQQPVRCLSIQKKVKTKVKQTSRDQSPVLRPTEFVFGVDIR
ncbi:cytosolic carboxypeptidase 2-like isoform X2 [Artemia franciscana]